MHEPEPTLADVVPALLTALGVPGFPSRLAVPDADAACVLLIDGLGWELLAGHAAHAPVLAAAATAGRSIVAGFPATTATSLASLTIGVPAGRHGIVGASFAIPDVLPHPGPALDALRWRTFGIPDADSLDTVAPERVQPEPTMLERATAAGVHVWQVAPAHYRESGLNGAVLRGGTFRGVLAIGDLAAGVIDALGAGRPTFCYAYHGDLDLLGHRYGPGSPEWCYQLRQIDRLVGDLAAALPPRALLAVVADHGMVRLAGDQIIDADAEPDLLAGVRLVTGDIRARHVYTERGADVAQVLATWRGALGGNALVLSRAEAIEQGWFGPEVIDRVRDRIGDVVVAAVGGGGVVRSQTEPHQSQMIGHHGSFDPAERLVPFLLLRQQDGRPAS